MLRRLIRHLGQDFGQYQRSLRAERDRTRAQNRPALGHHDQTPLGWQSRGQGAYFNR